MLAAAHFKKMFERKPANLLSKLSAKISVKNKNKQLTSTERIIVDGQKGRDGGLVTGVYIFVYVFSYHMKNLYWDELKASLLEFQEFLLNDEQRVSK